MYGVEAPFDSRYLDEPIFPDKDDARPVKRQSNAEKQHAMDSFLESVCNIAVGFVISWAVWVWLVAPLFGFNDHAGLGFLVTCIYTVTSLIRQFVIRRLFNGRTIYEVLVKRDV